MFFSNPKVSVGGLSEIYGCDRSMAHTSIRMIEGKQYMYFIIDDDHLSTFPGFPGPSWHLTNKIILIPLEIFIL